MPSKNAKGRVDSLFRYRNKPKSLPPISRQDELTIIGSYTAITYCQPFSPNNEPMLKSNNPDALKAPMPGWR